MSVSVARSEAVIKSRLMNERQQAHIDYFLERFGYWATKKDDPWHARLLAARDADNTYPLRTEEEGTEVFDYLSRLEQESEAETDFVLTKRERG